MYVCVCVCWECPFQNFSVKSNKVYKKKNNKTRIERKETRKYFHISFNEHSKKAREVEEEGEEREEVQTNCKCFVLCCYGSMRAKCLEQKWNFQWKSVSYTKCDVGGKIAEETLSLSISIRRRLAQKQVWSWAEKGRGKKGNIIKRNTHGRADMTKLLWRYWVKMRLNTKKMKDVQIEAEMRLYLLHLQCET